MQSPQNLIPDHKTQKYDRQLRLWESHGQSALENAKLLLINADATGAECLKNLVLAGIGSFTILDANNVTPADTGSSFFTPVESIDKPRSETVTANLLELNDLVTGTSITQSLSQILEHENITDFVSKFSLVIVSNCSEEEVVRLAELCWETDTPFIELRTNGFFGYQRIQMREFGVLEPHPSSIKDLRITNPFPELLKLAEEIVDPVLDAKASDDTKMEDASTQENVNQEPVRVNTIPYALILIYYINKWVKEHGQLPQSRALKSHLSSLLSQHSHHENIQEVLSHCHLCQPYTIPSSTLQLINDSRCNVTKKSKSFWILIAALKMFVDERGTLPLAGVIPDMKSGSSLYGTVRNTYYRQHQMDIQTFTHHLHSILTSLSLPNTHISDSTIKTFIKNAKFLSLVEYRPLCDEYLTDSKVDDKTMDESNGKDCMVVEKGLEKSAINYTEGDIELWTLYVCFRALENARLDKEGSSSSTLLQACRSLLQKWESLNPSLKGKLSIDEKWVTEFSRACNSQLHPTSCLVGGLSSQECLKILTGQYTPVDGTVIWDGVRGRVGVFKL